MSIYAMPLEKQLDARLDELFKRPGINDSKKIQSALSAIAHNCLKILQEQRSAGSRKQEAGSRKR